MMKMRLCTVLAASLSAPAAAQGPAIVYPGPSATATMSPTEAIVAAASRAPAAANGTFALTVRASGRSGARVYLNSERDYRDQRNLTISIDPAAASALAKRFGERPEKYFRGKAIVVKGAARRVRIDFVERGRPTGLYYFQTHVRVIYPGQIARADAD